MKKEKLDPNNPPLEDLQGHSYQHELGDPDVEEELEEVLNRTTEAKSKPKEKALPPHRVIPLEETEHRMEYQQQRARSKLPAHIKLPTH